MEEWKQTLKELLDDLPAFFGEIHRLLSPSSPRFNDFVHQSSRFQAVQMDLIRGTINRADADLTLNNIRFALLQLLDMLESSDLKAEFQPAASEEPAGPPLGEYHSLTCDRVPQNDRFHELFQQQKETKKTHFFYVYGLDRHSHLGLFNRIAYDLEGRLLDYLNPDYHSETQTLRVDLTFEVSNNPDRYKQNILRSLFARLKVPVNENEPLLEKNLAFLLQTSPLFQDLGPEDFVATFLSISQWDWDSRITPTVTRWFIEKFCSVQLPESAPTFLFFFGIIFEEEDEELQDEVRQVVTNSELIQPLPELDMVLTKDIARWFAKYTVVAPDSEKRKELRKKYFGDGSEFYMEEVEKRLRQIIAQHNARSLGT